MPGPSSEYQFILAAAQAAAGLRDRLAAVPQPIDLDGPLLLSEAARRGLRASVLDALAAMPVLPPGIDREDINRRRLKIAATNLMSLSAARHAIRTLSGSGIRAVLGPSPSVVMMLEGVACELGRSSIAVPAADVEAARSLLNTDALAVESIDAGMLDRSIEASAAGGTIRVPSRDDLLTAVCRSGEESRWQRIDCVLAATVLLQRLNGSRPGNRHGVPALDLATAIRQSWFLPLTDTPRAEPRRKIGVARRELWVAGFPSAYGGADTELDHLIDLLRDRDVQVHLVPMFGADEGTRQSVLDRGCHIHEYRDDIFRDKTVASFCNGEFLAALPAIRDAGRPARVIWFNCMTWLFEREREAHARGWIDVFGFQSEYQRHALTSQLEAIGPVRTFPYQPYFHAPRIAWSYREWNGSYHVGRISRDDSAKYAPDTWRIFERVRVPPHLEKKVYVLGYGENAARKIGAPPSALNCDVRAPGEVPAEDFYRTIDTMVHKTGGSRENYPRVIVEAYAYGVVPIVEKDFGLPELVVHGETGFLTSNSDEMSEYAGMLAHDPRAHRRLAENGRRHLEQILSAPDACWAGWEHVLEL